MKRLISLLLSIMILSSFSSIVSINAYAAKIISGDYTYKTDGNGEATILSYNGKDFDVEIPEELDGHKVTKIADEAFVESDYNYLDKSYISVIRTVTIPSTIEKISPYNFYSLPYINNIFVDKDNKNYTADKGVLFNKDKTKLINYPTARLGSSYTVPKSVKTIGAVAFYGCKYLKSVELTNKVKSIQGMAFFDCREISGIYVPKSVKKIGNYAFGCKKEYSTGWYNPSIDDEFWDASEQLDTVISPLQGFVLYGEKNSTAQKYCKKSETDFFDNKADRVVFKAVSIKKPKLKAKGEKGKLSISFSWNKNITEFELHFVKGKKKWNQSYAVLGAESVKGSMFSTSFKKMKKGTYKIKIRTRMNFGGHYVYTPWSKTVSVKIG